MRVPKSSSAYLLGSWDCVLPPEAPAEIRHQKFVTPGRYVWVTLDRNNRQILSVSGGTWALAGDTYAESCEFASDSHQHLRGKMYKYTVTGHSPEVGHQGSGRDGDRCRRSLEPDQSTLDGRQAQGRAAGGALLGTWEGKVGEGAPQRLRILKYITPTHWTWAIFDRENKMVVAAMGGTWKVKNGKYVETVDFTTDNTAQARGNSYVYGFEVSRRPLVHPSRARAAGGSRGSLDAGQVTSDFQGRLEYGSVSRKVFHKM